MCGRFSRFTGQDAIIAHYGVDHTRSKPLLSYNIAPSQVVSVVRRDNPVILEDMKWGFIPFYAKDPASSNTPINARDDSLGKNMYKYAINSSRCIIPADGFFEWKRFGPLKQPYFIKRADGELMSFGGIFSSWKNKETNQRVYSFAIITTPPNDQMKEIHDRMPLIIEQSDEERWLEPQKGYKGVSELIQSSSAILEIYPVSRYVNSPKNDGDRCIEPIPESKIGRDDKQQSLEDFF